jgi:hypothetical protein
MRAYLSSVEVRKDVESDIEGFCVMIARDWKSYSSATRLIRPERSEAYFRRGATREK